MNGFPYFYNTGTTSTSTYKPCKEKGFYHTVKFLFFKRRFIACELCGQKHEDTGWKIFL